MPTTVPNAGSVSLKPLYLLCFFPMPRAIFGILASILHGCRKIFFLLGLWRQVLLTSPSLRLIRRLPYNIGIRSSPRHHARIVALGAKPLLQTKSRSSRFCHVAAPRIRTFSASVPLLYLRVLAPARNPLRRKPSFCSLKAVLPRPALTAAQMVENCLAGETFQQQAVFSMYLSIGC